MAVNDEIAHTDGDAADPARSCVRKRGYPSEAIARQAVQAVRRVNPSAQVRPYGCRHCGQWHVGGVPVAEQVYVAAAPLDDSFDAERDRRRRDHGGWVRRRPHGDYHGHRVPRRRDRYEDA